MNGTPRLRSAYPATPRSGQKNGPPASQTQSPTKRKNEEQNISIPGGGGVKASQPVIPLSVIDAPTQRFYVAAFYVGLSAWRLLDYSQLLSSDTDSLWLFMKWAAIDGAFLYGIPGLRIPWLEWSSTTMTVLFLFHATINAVLMFRIPIPFGAWLVGFARMIYDREIAVSERKVKPASLLQNPSLISGKQIIHILPEGSAMLNPDRKAFCIGNSKTPTILPIFINQTNPISLEILRIDLESNANETISISQKELKKMKKQSNKEVSKKDQNSPRILKYPVKQTGLYRLLKVVDESNLEVQRRLSDTLVVTCPSGSVKAVPRDKCRGQLSDFRIQVDAVPPLKVKYSKTINGEPQSDVALTIHPDNFDTPLGRQQNSGVLVKSGSEGYDVSWARNQLTEIPVNETLGIDGSWIYSLDEVRDGCGNVVDYTKPEDYSLMRLPKGASNQQSFVVHERPRAILDGCTSQTPLKVAKGKSRHLPIRFNPTGQHKTQNMKHHITYSFTPEDASFDDTVEAANQDPAIVQDMVISPNDRGPKISDPGVYVLTSVATEFCGGEVLEPSSCLLSNPPLPQVMITSEEIPHQCAGNSVGLLVTLDFIGTPPFSVSYSEQQNGGERLYGFKKVNEMRAQFEFKPREAGHYVYEFLEMVDSVYEEGVNIEQSDRKLEQDVKPTAWATFSAKPSLQKMCIQEPASFDVKFTGEPPWTLEYDLVHNGKRMKHKLTDIVEKQYQLITPPLKEGGQYSLSLTSVIDASGCKIHLKEEAKVEVRLQRPSAAFGMIEGGRSALTLQGKKIDLPLRLSGEPPWSLAYTKASEPETILKRRVAAANDILPVTDHDTYRILEVSDRFCPGSIDSKASEFEVLWVPRPTVKLPESSVIKQDGAVFHKVAVCEGDQDYLDLTFAGNPPYFLKYDVHTRPEKGSSSVKSKQDKFGLQSASIRMETTKPAVYEYRVVELGDQLYNHDRKSFSPLAVQQRVNSRPNAAFANPGRTYNYCKEEDFGDEIIPITLSGSPPFSIEIGIKHHAAAYPEILTVPNIESNKYSFHIPHSALSLGLHTVSIKKVSDSNGCHREMNAGGPVARVSVVDVPSISPTETNTDYCVGDWISYTLAGTAPFNVYYIFEGAERKAPEPSNSFRRIAERPGNFTITAISDKASTDTCRARINFTKVIHPLPSVKISKGRTLELDIHEGGEAELLFEFEGTPPFEFTWTRSTNAAKGKSAKILETKTDVSQEFSKTVHVSEEGTYEVVSVRDRYCGVSAQKKKVKLLAF